MKPSVLGGVLARLALLTLLALAAACSNEPSVSSIELLVVVDADPALRARLDEIAIATDTDGQSFFPGAPESKVGAVKWPFSVTVIANAANSTRAFVNVRGLAEGTELVRRSANLKLMGGAERPVWHVYLTSSCEGLWKTCDETDRGTCLPCGTTCESEVVDVSKLPSSSMDAAALASNFPECKNEPGTDAGPDGGPDPLDMDGGDDAGKDGGGDDAGKDGGGDDAGKDGSTPDPVPDAGDGGDESLMIDMPAVVAAPGCIALTITRSDASGAQNLSLSSNGHGTFHSDPDCTLPFQATAAFAAGTSSIEVYFAPVLADATNNLRTSIDANLGAGLVQTPVELRRRTMNVVRSSDSHCALASNATGSLYCVEHGPEMVKKFDDLTPYSSLSSYFKTSCAVVRATAGASAGKVLCWGSNERGQFGDDSFTSTNTPVEPLGLGNQIRQVSAGVYHTCAVKLDGSLYCWGQNTLGIINNSSDEYVRTPTLSTHLADVGETDGVVEVTTAWDVTCVRTVNNEVYCWGGADFQSRTAVKVSMPPALHISVGAAQVCAISDSNLVYCASGTNSSRFFTPPDGVVLNRISMGFHQGCVASERELYCWGSNAQGWLGTGSPELFDSTPDKVDLPAGKLDAFSVAGFYSVFGSAVVDGLVYAWGYAFDDIASTRHGIDLGLEPKLELTPNPVIASAKSLSMSPYTSCTIDHAGALACWGSGAQIGNGQGSVEYGAFASKPLAIGSMSTGVTQVETAAQWAVAIKDGKAYSWGGDATGQLGNGAAGASPSPALMADQSDAVLDVAAAYGKGCALVQSGVNQRQVYCWGGWGDPVLTSPALVMSGDDGLNDVDLQDREGCALDNGTVKCWRDRNFTETARSGMPTNVVKIEMDGDEGEGSYRATLCARTANNTVYCTFGSEPASQLFSNASDLSVGAGHACIITTTGGVQCAGANRAGQVDFNNVSSFAGAGAVPGLSGVTAIQLGSDSSCAKNASGWHCWGSNELNQFGLSSILVTTPTLIAPWK